LSRFSEVLKKVGYRDQSDVEDFKEKKFYMESEDDLEIIVDLLSGRPVLSKNHLTFLPPIYRIVKCMLYALCLERYYDCNDI